MIEFVGIGKRFPGVQALNEVSFTIAPGTCHALLGENGAGKSTLGRLLAGVYEPDSGSIRVGGRALSDYSPRGAMQAGISLVHQELALCPNLTVAENLLLARLPGWKCGINRVELHRRATELLLQVGLEIPVDRLVETLSPGEEQLVQIAAAVGGGARVLIFDEPTSSLGAADASRLFELIRRLRAGGTTIIYVSHRLEEVFDLCDSVTVLRDGQHVKTCELAGLTHDELIRLMVGREIGQLEPPLPVKPDAPVVLGLDDVRVAGTQTTISLQVRAGEIVGLAGLVGAGRTELLEAIYRVRAITSGSVRIRGLDWAGLTPTAAQLAGIGLIPEDRKRSGLVLQDSVADNLTLPILDRFRGWLGKLRREPRRAHCTREVGHYRIRTPDLGARTAGLSGGNQQKIVFSKGIAVGTQVLLVDEPTRGVDVGAKQEIHQLLRERSSAGVAILLVSSELPELLALSHRIIVFRHRAMVAEFERSEFDSEKILAAMAGAGSAVESR